MYVKQNEEGKWCVYDVDGQKISEHDTEEEANKALADRGRETGDRLASMTSKVRASGDKGEADVKVLFDTGASLSFVLRSVAEKLATITKMPKPYKIVIGDASTFSVTDMAVLSIKAAGQTIMDTFLVLEQGVEDVILGEATMRKFGLKIDLEHGVIFSEMKVESGKQKAEIKKKEKIMDEAVKKFLEKLFVAFSIEADEEITDEEAVELLKAKMAQSEPPKRPKTAVPLSLLELLGLGEDASESDARGAIMALKFPSDRIPVDRYRNLEDQMHERDVNELIERACRPGEGEMEGKLYPHEREWALGEAKKDYETMKAFIKHRPKVLTIMSKLPSGKKDPAQIDATQEAINRQMGLSRETFVKYNSTH